MSKFLSISAILLGCIPLSISYGSYARRQSKTEILRSQITSSLMEKGLNEVDLNSIVTKLQDCIDQCPLDAENPYFAHQKRLFTTIKSQCEFIKSNLVFIQRLLDELSPGGSAYRDPTIVEKLDHFKHACGSVIEKLVDDVLAKYNAKRSTADS